MVKPGEFKLDILAAGPLQTNTYLLTSGDESILIDSGAGHAEICKKLSLEKRNIKALVMTHGHFDHIFDAMEYRRKFHCRLMMGSGDEPITEWSYSVSERYMGRSIERIEIDRYLGDEEIIELGESEVLVKALPGHTPGSIGIIAGNIFLTGDTLFRGTIGRTDAGGSMEEMENSLKKIAGLNPELKVFPGHGPESTLRTELEINPFLKRLK